MKKKAQWIQQRLREALLWQVIESTNSNTQNFSVACLAQLVCSEALAQLVDGWNPFRVLDLFSCQWPNKDFLQNLLDL